MVTVTSENPTPPSVFPLVPCCPKTGNAPPDTSLACLVTGYFPAPVEIKWNLGKVTQGITTFPEVMMSKGLFTQSSLLINPARSRQGDTYQCDVTHKGTAKTLSKKFPQEGCGSTTPPQVHLLVPTCEESSTESQLELLCLLLSFKPNNANVKWLVNGKESSPPTPAFSPAMGTDGFYMGQSRMNVTKQSWEKGDIYTCQVTHPAVGAELSMHNTSKCLACLRSSLDPTIYLTKPSYEDVIKNSGHVTCLVLGYDLAASRMAWKVDGQVSSAAKTEPPKKNSNGTTSLVSSHPVSLAQWGQGTKFTCKVTTPCSGELTQDITMSNTGISKKEPSVTISRAYQEDISGNRVSLTLICEASGFYPEEISISWLKNNSLELKLSYNNGPVSGSGTFSAYSILKVDKSGGAVNYTCVVHHPAMEEPKRVVEKVSLDFLEPSPPTVTVFHTPDIGGHENLTCFATGFYPKDLDMRWTVNKQHLSCSSPSSPTALGDGRFQQSCQLELRAAEWSTLKTYTCIVTHSSTKTTLEKVLHSTGCREPALLSSYIQPPSLKELFMNKSASVMCKTSLANASINWTMDGEMADLGAVRMEQHNGSTWLQSWLQVNLSEWNSTETITCQIKSDLAENVLGISPKNGSLKAPTIYLLSPSSEEICSNQNLTLHCIVKDFYPGEISVWWQEKTAQTEVDIAADDENHNCDHNSQQCSVISKLEVSRSRWILGTSYSCLVAHLSSEGIIARSANVHTESWHCSVLGINPCSILDNSMDDYSELDDAQCVWTTVSTFIALFLITLFYSGFVTFIKERDAGAVQQAEQEESNEGNRCPETVRFLLFSFSIDALVLHRAVRSWGGDKRAACDRPEDWPDQPRPDADQASGKLLSLPVASYLEELPSLPLAGYSEELPSLPPAISATAPSVFPLTSCTGEVTTSPVTFGCLAKGYFPEPVTVTWSPNVGSSGVRTYPSMLQPSSGLYSLSSQVTVPASSWTSNTYSCTVKHQPTSRSISKEIPKPTPIEPHAPEVHVLHSSCTTKPGAIQLLCFISGFYPEPLKVEWLVDGESGLIHGDTAPAKKDADGRTFSTRSNASVSQDVWLEGKTYTCQVSHPGTGSKKQARARKCQEETSSSNIQVFLVPPSPAALYVAQSPMLTCLVVNLPSDSGLQVVWSREKPGSVIPDPLTLTDQFNDTFTASSSMPIFTRDWEAGETFTCKVEHSELISPLIKSISKKPGKHSAPGVYLLRPHNDELISKGDSVSLTCLVRGFFPEDISVQWMKNHEGEKETDYITTPPMKDGDGDSNFFLYSKLKVSKASWNRGDTYTCMVIHEALSLKFTQRSVSKVSEVIMSGEFCSEDEDEELGGLWSSISVFITLFLLSVCYSATVTLFKVKWFFSTMVQLKKASGPEYKNVIQRVV
ncbi:uncharacterized protein LOC120380832 [Mauremys reevesii]|uniref:uncharacterized protein LOC120380832 n=1 Tax=Mauremys reevesii TaxID=260615 RepID=UPI00193F29C8|nr:uncharacterized protein LOC120380832 [Mauremys reevesii]